MRASLLPMALLFGATAMSDAIAEDKKPNTRNMDDFTEKVTLRVFKSGVLINPTKDVPTFVGEIDGKKVLWLITPECTKGSEITDKDGNVWVVDKSTRLQGNFVFHMCPVTKQEKKP